MVVPIKPIAVDYSPIAINLDDSNEGGEHNQDGSVEDKVQEEPEEKNVQQEWQQYMQQQFGPDAHQDFGEDHDWNQDEFDAFEEYGGFSMAETDKEAELHDVPIQNERENDQFVDSDYEQEVDEIGNQTHTNMDQRGSGEVVHEGTSSKGKEAKEVYSEIEWSDDELNTSCESDNDEILPNIKNKRRYTEFNPTLT